MFSELGRKKSARVASKPKGRSESERSWEAPKCFTRTKLICGIDVVCQGVATDLMARADAEELRNARIGSTGGTDGGNSGKFSDERPEGERNRQDSP